MGARVQAQQAARLTICGTELVSRYDDVRYAYAPDQPHRGSFVVHSPVLEKSPDKGLFSYS